MKIEKRNYSRSPWRLIDNNGNEVYAQKPMKHADLGHTFVTEPVCGATKAECIAATLELLGLCFARLNAGIGPNPAAAIRARTSAPKTAEQGRNPPQPGIPGLSDNDLRQLGCDPSKRATQQGITDAEFKAFIGERQ